MVLCVSALAELQSGMATGENGQGKQAQLLRKHTHSCTARPELRPCWAGWKCQVGSFEPAGRGKLLFICTGVDLVLQRQIPSSITTNGRSVRWR